LRRLQRLFGLLTREQTCRAHEDNGIFDLEMFETTLRLDILRENAQRPSRSAIEEGFIPVRLSQAAPTLIT
jgi:tRNA A58 N-methylase Trm61